MELIGREVGFELILANLLYVKVKSIPFSSYVSGIDVDTGLTQTIKEFLNSYAAIEKLTSSHRMGCVSEQSARMGV